jgi:glycosyltransferase involved in cell wall biosynthesis
MKLNRIAIVRASSTYVDINKYNVQEIGLAKALIHNGINVDLYFRVKGNSSIKNIDENTKAILNVIPLSGVEFKKIVWHPSLIKKLVNGHYDLVQIQEEGQLTSPFIAKRLNKEGIPIVLYQGMYQNYSGFGFIYQKLFDTLFLRKLQSNLTYILAKTNAARKYLENKGYDGVKVLPVGLDERQYVDSKHILGESFSSKFANTLLYIGILESRRKLEIVIESLEHLNETCLIIVGDGPSRDFLESYVIQRGVNGRVLFLGRVKNSVISCLFAIADVFVLPTTYEIFGMVILESLRFGVPVVATKTAGPLDILTESYLGECVNLNVNDWVISIKKVLSENTNNSKNKELRRNYISTNYSWFKIVKDYLNYVG